MRRFLFLFMVFLLSLRGLVGDAMALQHAPAELVQAGAEEVKPLSPGAEHAMAQHGRVQDAEQAGCGNMNTDHGGHCSSCGICHSAMATPQWQSLNQARLQAAQPAHGAERFVSAALAELIKPPVV